MAPDRQGEDKARRQGQKGRRTALLIAAVALAWVGATFIGGQLGWSQRTRALFDLIALAGFAFALWQAYQLWRARQDD